MDLGKILRRSALYWPDREAVVDSRQRITFADLERRTSRLASGLLALALALGQGARASIYIAPAWAMAGGLPDWRAHWHHACRHWPRCRRC
ncbi:AMP-binding protein [Pseudomonas sp. PDM19]|uniref:AMP-binding protein n=1 Tax=Pseudomonas sp. PDM19 TaxID=2769272 RepID=UPI0017843099|nr:AMP-binding protein [Pseudomonas sp. PDM19]MBD9629404.1 hypothetical protein [Pseudomonas sp. PDM19]